MRFCTSFVCVCTFFSLARFNCTSFLLILLLCTFFIHFFFIVFFNMRFFTTLLFCCFYITDLFNYTYLYVLGVEITRNEGASGIWHAFGTGSGGTKGHVYEYAHSCTLMFFHSESCIRFCCK